MSTIRRATEADIPYMLALAKEKYPDRPVEQGVPWMQWCLQNPERLVLLGQDHIGVAQVNWHYGYSRRARLDWLVGRPVKGAVLETLRMVRMMIAWAKEQGATGDFQLDAETEVDFEPYSKRLGGRKITVTRYLIPINPQG
jgi:hypothetical protein